LIAAPARPVAERLPGDRDVQPIKALLLTVKGLVFDGNRPAVPSYAEG